MSLISHALKLACVATTLFGASAAVAGTIVVRSTGPSAKSYPAGKSLPDNSQVTLKAGDIVTVLTKGGTRVLSGPGSFNASAAATTASGSALNRLLSNTTTRQSRTGASRGPGTVAGKMPRNPSLWFVDISRSATTCLASAGATSLWRPTSMTGQMLTLTDVASNKSAAIEFASGTTSKPWPSAVQIKDGAEYRLAGDGLKIPTLIKFKIMTVPGGAANQEGIIAALAQNGCAQQLDLVADSAATG